jgi:hypothetical protein
MKKGTFLRMIIILVMMTVGGATGTAQEADSITILQLIDKKTDLVLEEMKFEGLTFKPVGNTWVYTPKTGNPVIVENNAATPKFVRVKSNWTSNESIVANPFKAYIANGTLFVSGDKMINDVRIYSVSGALVANTIGANNEVNMYVGNLPSGVYIVRVNNQHSFKVIK